MKQKFLSLALAITLLLSCSLTNSNYAFATEFDSGANDLKTVAINRFTEPVIYTTRSVETINYSSYQIVEENTTPNECPLFYYSQFTNACGAISGASIIAYYDKYYENLIPNYTTFYQSGRYKAADATYIPALISDLYTRMRINIDDVGVGYTDYLNGLSGYVSSKGRTATYTSTYSPLFGVNYSTTKTAINNGNLLAVFCDPTSVVQINFSNTSANITSTNIASSHIMVVYGYIKIKYTFTNNTTRTDTYLQLSTGISSARTAWLPVDSDDIVELQKIIIS